MNLDTEILKLRLIEAQAQLLQYQHKEVSANIASIEAQKKFDASVDARDTPSGATKQPDEFRGD
jgi:hypothetical protein